MSLPTKPTENLPDWDVTNAPDAIEPSGSKKSNGYVPLEPFPAQHLNWLLSSISYWLTYLVSLTDVLQISFGVASTGTVDVNAPVTLNHTDHEGKVLVIDNSGNNVTITLPAVADADNMKFTAKDLTGDFGEFPVEIIPNTTDEIEGINDSYFLEASYGQWTLFCNGVEWFFI